MNKVNVFESGREDGEVKDCISTANKRSSPMFSAVYILQLLSFLGTSLSVRFFFLSQKGDLNVLEDPSTTVSSIQKFTIAQVFLVFIANGVILTVHSRGYSILVNALIIIKEREKWNSSIVIPYFRNNHFSCSSNFIRSTICRVIKCKE